MLPHGKWIPRQFPRNKLALIVPTASLKLADYCAGKVPAEVKRTRSEIFSESYQINPKSDCIYHFPIDLEQQTDSVRLLFQINRKMVNTI